MSLLDQLTVGKVHLASASGLGDELGTDATKVMEILESCPRDSDIVILFDLGSALMSCEVALELLGPDFASRVTIADAPFVEGAIAAAVESSLGHSREVVVGSALSARHLVKMQSDTEGG
uniref:PTS-dependent dihydroxyacetone kinase phosphotransferase subunit DhaM n=1 Tax=Alicyclobacillus tolerans TaxID=90970 RepID=UPI001F307D83|nr:dihydroxyacetone kinase [Alicyclobacillus tolerans]